MVCQSIYKASLGSVCRSLGTASTDLIGSYCVTSCKKVITWEIEDER